MAVPGRKAEMSKNEQCEELSDIFCQPCEEDGQQLSAAGFCVDCCEYLCEDCFSVHRRARPSRNHVLQDKTTMPRNIYQRKTPEMADGVCNEHKRATIDFYCRSHDYFGCGTCMTVDHRSCDDISYVEKEYKELSEKLIHLEEQIISNDRNIEENVKCIEQHYSDAIVNIGQFRSETNELLDKLEHDIIDRAKTIKDEDQTAMISISAKLDDIKNEISSTITDINTLHNLQKNRKLFAIIDKTKEEMKRLDNTLTQMQNENTIRRYVFEPEKQLKDLFANLKSIGNMSVMNESRYDNGIPTITTGEDKTFFTREKTQHQQQQQQQQKIGDSQTAAVNSKVTQTEYSMNSKETETQTCRYEKDDTLRVVTHISDINVNSFNDNKSYGITGLVLLLDNQLVIADYNNNKLKLVNTKQNKMTDEIRLSSSPCDVTMINYSKVAVTLYKPGIIAVLSVVSRPIDVYGRIFSIKKTYTLSVDRDIKVNGHCRGIVYNDGTFIVTFTEPGKVEIITMSGDVLKSLGDALLFSRPFYIAINSDKTAVYVSDKDNHSVTCMTLDGKVKAVYKDDNLKCPTALTIDRSGTVYVCGEGSNTIHHITAGCTKMHILLHQQHGISQPRSITYCDEDHLYVGMDNNVVKLLNLQ